ncbi:peptidylprolyl isomerase [Aquibacillus saliphilus]|uniref:peptidylprolyl isomerase n=1 Tax=Aquibacillus saliphilus TaxID=1909422 RepID=UPI001CEFC953|nr:peptidylprolyl isomerase [Aquibacillus saliphilus]
MTRRLLWGIIILLFVTNLTTLVVWINSSGDPAEDFSVSVNKKEPVATIAGEDISYKEWANQLEDKFGEQVLKDMIDKKLVFQLAEEQNLNLNDKLIERELSLLYTMDGILTKEQIEKKREEWIEDIRYRYFMEELLTKNVDVSENEIAAYYDSYKNQYEFSESIQLSHILVDDQKTAEKIISELESGASFNLLAREYSIDEETKSDGGYLGYYTEGSNFLPSDYYNKAMDMEEHTYSQPFLTAKGVAIIYLHRLLPEVSFTYGELKNHIRREVALEQVETIISANPLWIEADIEWIYE